MSKSFNFTFLYLKAPYEKINLDTYFFSEANQGFHDLLTFRISWKDKSINNKFRHTPRKTLHLSAMDHPVEWQKYTNTYTSYIKRNTQTQKTN